MLQASERGLACSAFYGWNATAIKSSSRAFAQRNLSYNVFSLLQLFFLPVSLILNSRIKALGGHHHSRHRDTRCQNNSLHQESEVKRQRAKPGLH